MCVQSLLTALSGSITGQIWGGLEIDFFYTRRQHLILKITCFKFQTTSYKLFRVPLKFARLLRIDILLPSPAPGQHSKGSDKEMLEQFLHDELTVDKAETLWTLVRNRRSAGVRVRTRKQSFFLLGIFKAH